MKRPEFDDVPASWDHVLERKPYQLERSFHKRQRQLAADRTTASICADNGLPFSHSQREPIEEIEKRWLAREAERTKLAQDESPSR